MLPTLAADGDMVWISSRYRYGRGVKVGDMVSFKHPCVPDAAAIKRVVGMPGDFVMRDVHDGRNDTMLQVGDVWICCLLLKTMLTVSVGAGRALLGTRR